MAVHPLHEDTAAPTDAAAPLRARLEAAQPRLLDAVRRHHACDPRLVGSLARREEHDGSDVDLLVRFTSEATLLDEVGLRQEIEDLLDASVDIIAEDAVGGDVRARLDSEARPL
jgi:uncharacterized protein